MCSIDFSLAKVLVMNVLGTSRCRESTINSLRSAISEDNVFQTEGR